jgi:hypothetical protein
MFPNTEHLRCGAANPGCRRLFSRRLPGASDLFQLEEAA